MLHSFGCVWVKREDLPQIAEEGILFVTVEDGDKLFKKDNVTGSYICVGEHHDAGDHPELVVISLYGEDITAEVKRKQQQVIDDIRHGRNLRSKAITQKFHIGEKNEHQRSH
jgi:hypothetical protein